MAVICMVKYRKHTSAKCIILQTIILTNSHEINCYAVKPIIHSLQKIIGF